MFGKLLLSFGAGLLGFLSPCCLPLLPGYVSYMTGGSIDERVPLRRALPGTLGFVGGHLRHRPRRLHDPRPPHPAAAR